MSNKVEEWKEEIEKLSSVAGSQPHAAYAAFVRGTKHKWSYISRTVPKLWASIATIGECNPAEVYPGNFW